MVKSSSDAEKVLKKAKELIEDDSDLVPVLTKRLSAVVNLCELQQRTIDLLLKNIEEPRAGMDQPEWVI